MARALTPQELTRALQLLARDDSWKKELRKLYAKLGRKGAAWARAELKGQPAQIARAAAAVRGGSSSTQARVGASSKAVPNALAAIWGTKGGTGWAGGWYDKQYVPSRAAAYAAAGTRNNPPWVGNDWTVATRGQGPRGINSALADHQDELVDMFADAALDVVTRAFPRAALR